jgi:hypothetical protein
VKDELFVRWLLDKGADPNFGRPQAKKLNTMEADNESGFALEKAERARFLLENGVDPYLKNWRGRSAFGEAQRLRYTDFLKLFQEYCPVDKNP